MRLLLICPKCVEPILKVSLTAKSCVINGQLHYASGWEEIYECTQCKYLGINCIEANASYLEMHNENKTIAKIKKERMQKEQQAMQKLIKQQQVIDSINEISIMVKEPVAVVSVIIEQQKVVSEQQIHQELNEIKSEITKQEMEILPIKTTEAVQLALIEVKDKSKPVE
ncbi:MAG: hypothetical protein Q7S21_00265 [archaeon]|nr:hypothetical protein [archaeon]